MVAEADNSHRRVKVSVRDLTISYGANVALSSVSFDILENEIFGIIGPANSGKTSFLRALNRMDMFTSSMNVQGEIVFKDRNIRDVRNVYALLRVNPQRFPRVRGAAARELEDFFLESASQARIAGFGRERFGRPLFRPLRLHGGVDAPPVSSPAAP